MPEYQYKNIPLTPRIATDNVHEHLSTQAKPIRRVELIRHVADRHLSLGGTIVGNPQGRVMTALRRLVDEGKVSNPSFGWYLLNTQSTAEITNLSVDQTPLAEILQNEVELIASEIVIGNGDESVYVYFSDAERKLAKFEKRDWWPCKVGFTAGNLTTRILSQGPLTSMSQLPVVGLVIKTDDGHALERIIHYALGVADAQIDDALGSEWFNTSPEKIKSWFENYALAIASLRR